MAEMLNKILDVVMLFAIVISAVVSIDVAGDILPEDTGETACTVTTETTIGETTKPTQIPTETTEPVTVPPETTEETQPPVMLYDVPMSRDLQIHIIRLCEEKRIAPAIVFAMIWRESSFRASVIGDNGKSLGLMQVQPKWCMEEMQMLGCTNLLDPYQNVTVGVEILAEKLQWYNGDIAKAVTAYNAGHYTGAVSDYARDVLEMAERLMDNGRYPG